MYVEPEPVPHPPYPNNINEIHQSSTAFAIQLIMMNWLTKSVIGTGGIEIQIKEQGNKFSDMLVL